MDENNEPKEQPAAGEKQASEKKPLPVVPAEKKEAARKAWDADNQKREKNGEKISEEERKAQQEFIEKGRGPIGGGSSDNYFEHFPEDKYKETPLYEIAKKLKEQGQNNEVTEESLQEVKKTVDDLAGLGTINDDQHRRFLADINKIAVAKNNNLPFNPLDLREAGSTPSSTRRTEIATPDIKKYKEFNETLFEATPIENIARRIKAVGSGSGEDIDKITQEYKELKPSLSPELQTKFDEEILRVQELKVEEEVNLFEKYADKPQLLSILRQLDNMKQSGTLDQQALNAQVRTLQRMMENGEITGEEARAFIEDMRKFAGVEPPKERIARNNITSIQDVAKIIINDEGEDRWGSIEGVPVGEKSDAIYPLLERLPDGKLRINKANFMQWARERTMYHHTNNSRDYQLQITNLVGVDNDFASTISIFTMDKNRNKYFKDEESGRILDDLADQLKTEIWLFGNIRNYDLLYQEYMGQDSKLPEFLINVHNKEELTRGDSLERIMTLSENFLGSEANKDNPQDTKVGDAARKGYEIYYYISDLEKLREILGNDSIFFKKEGLINVFKILEKKPHTEGIDPESMKQIEKLFNVDGTIKDKEFIQFINPFNDQNKPDLLINVTRELVRQAIAEKYGLEYGLEKTVHEERTKSGKFRAPEREFLRISTTYAETWAWIMSRFTGAAARNDTNSIGFDAFTKTMQFMKYRIRQSAAGRAGQHGNEYNLGVFKQLTLDFFNGVWVQKGFADKERTTPFELMLSMDKIDRQIEDIKAGRAEGDPAALQAKKVELAKRFRFDQFTQKGYAANHLGRAFEIFHNMLGNEELRLDQVVKYENFYGGAAGRYVLDRTKFEEVLKEKFVKPVRYAFSTYPMIDFAKEVRELTEWGGEKKLPKYETKTLAEAMFGPIVTAEFKKNAVNIKRESIKKKLKAKEEVKESDREFLKKRKFNPEEKEAVWKELLTGELRSQLWKRAVMARIAKDLLSHRIRTLDNKYEYFGEEQVELFLHALENIPSIDVVGGQDEDLKFAYGEKFLNEEDIKWIRKNSRTTGARLFSQDIAPNMAGGFIKGIGQGIAQIFKAGMKS